VSVRVGILGVGVMGSDHARILASQVPGATVQAIYDADPKRAKAVAEEIGSGTVVTDALTLIKDGSVDAVLVASPDQTHKELTLAGIAAQKPVLCEKPLAPTSAECLEVIAAEVKLGRRVVQIGYMRRFDPSYTEMKTGLASGRLGSALMFHCIHRNVAAPSWFDSKMAVSNSAVHEFDIARWVLDAELVGVTVFRPKPVNHRLACAVADRDERRINSGDRLSGRLAAAFRRCLSLAGPGLDQGDRARNGHGRQRLGRLCGGGRRRGGAPLARRGAPRRH
jgi:myo-inositol 2-dehydrogenase/D-chiro-inositol 1-dehydrogenase